MSEKVGGGAEVLMSAGPILLALCGLSARLVSRCSCATHQPLPRFKTSQSGGMLGEIEDKNEFVVMVSSQQIK